MAAVFALEHPFCWESNPGWALRGAARPDAVLVLRSLPAGALLACSVTSPEAGGQERRRCSIAEMRKLEDREQTRYSGVMTKADRKRKLGPSPPLPASPQDPRGPAVKERPCPGHGRCLPAPRAACPSSPFSRGPRADPSLTHKSRERGCRGSERAAPAGGILRGHQSSTPSLRLCE